MKIAVIGSGIAGMSAAYRLAERHDVTLIEAADYIGGHTNTINVEIGDERQAVDTGFIVYNPETYPHFIRLLTELGVSTQASEMTFSIRSDARNLEYSSDLPWGMFVQWRNLLRPSYYRMLLEISRFNQQTPDLSLPEHDRTTVREYIRANGYSERFIEDYLLPIGSAIWSCPRGTFEQFPIRFIYEFYRASRLLDPFNVATWRTVVGGSQTYVAALLKRFRGKVLLNTPIVQIRRDETGVDVVPRGSEPLRFDHAVVACHSDQALRMLADPSPVETELLSCFTYETNPAILHTDESVLPRRRRAWAAWNYRSEPGADRATITYYMNKLQRLTSKHHFCVTLNDESRIDPAKIIRRIEYHHPIFSPYKATAQARHREVINVRNTSFCGAYWGSGFHEDGIASAVAVCQALGVPTQSVTS